MSNLFKDFLVSCAIGDRESQVLFVAFSSCCNGRRQLPDDLVWMAAKLVELSALAYPMEQLVWPAVLPVSAVWLAAVWLAVRLGALRAVWLVSPAA